MARKKGIVWKHYTEITGKKSKEGQCTYCGCKYVSNVARMEKHLIKCKSAPFEVKEQFSKTKRQKFITHRHKQSREPVPGTSRSSCHSSNSESEECADTADDKSSESNDTDISETEAAHSQVDTTRERTSQHSRSQRPITGFLDKISETEQGKLEELFATAIYASAAPLSMAENPYWLEFLSRMRPSFFVPTRHLSNPLLEKAYNKINTDIKEKMNASQNITIISDGWSNLRNESIINVVLATPEPVFYKAFESGLFSDAYHHHVYNIISSLYNVLLLFINAKNIYTRH